MASAVLTRWSRRFVGLGALAHIYVLCAALAGRPV
jgi:hypothetical protein